MGVNNYYYNLLSKDDQKIYHAIKEGLENIAPSIVIPMTEGRNLANIYFMIRMDHPEIFYTVTFHYRFYQGAGHMELIPDYIFQKKTILEHKQAMASRVKKLARQAEKLDEKGKELFIHDFLCQNVTYDKLKKPYSHEIIGALGQGVAVCEGIAKAVKILCDELGIWCIIVLSEANKEKEIKYRHAWNLIKIGGEYYHLDVTFDNTLSRSVKDKGMIRYDYVNLCDEQIYRDHEPSIWPLPVCKDKAHSYYQEKKLSFTKLEDVRKRTAQAIKKKKILLFHWRGGYLTKEVLSQILEIFAEEASLKGKKSLVSLNWPQAVLMVDFKEDSSDDSDQSGLIVEEANEGEQYEESQL